MFEKFQSSEKELMVVFKTIVLEFCQKLGSIFELQRGSGFVKPRFSIYRFPFFVQGSNTFCSFIAYWFRICVSQWDWEFFEFPTRIILIKNLNFTVILFVTQSSFNYSLRNAILSSLQRAKTSHRLSFAKV